MEKELSPQTKKTTTEKKPWYKPARLPRSKYLWVIGIFSFIGVAGGYAYYALIGCHSGGCAITSNPYMSMIWGGAVGYLLPDFFVKPEQK